jgi:hypothetical protein
MKRMNAEFKRPVVILTKASSLKEEPVHATWQAFISFCAELQHGQIEILKIQNGLPVLAEITRKKVKFTT